ncbi:hypothetical protein H0H87_007156 [Tephrocybe sp. NHM501043]|nr:hypothetical protein H0H87_007156 [Tephrocybe sp. NHM501043]
MSIVEKHAFHRAEQIYERYLTAEEQARIQIPTSLADLVDKAAQFRNYRAKSPRFMMFSQEAMALEAFEKLIEGACEMSPKACGLIWGSVAFILEMVKEDATRLEKVTEFFLDMAKKVGKISFHLNELPISSVLDICYALYPAIVDFWLKAVKHYKVLKSDGIRDRIGAVAQFNYLDKKYQILASAINDQKSALERAEAGHLAAEVESDRVQSKLYPLATEN